MSEETVGPGHYFNTLLSNIHNSQQCWILWQTSTQVIKVLAVNTSGEAREVRDTSHLAVIFSDPAQLNAVTLCVRQTRVISLGLDTSITQMLGHFITLRPATATHTHYHINYTLALSTYKTRSTGTPAYLASLLESHRPAWTMRSSNNSLLTVPQLSLALSAKTFCVSGPTVWNSLPNSCKQAELVTTFKCKLKSKVLYRAYREQPTVYSV